MLSAMYHTFVSHLKLYSKIRELNPRPQPFNRIKFRSDVISPTSFHTEIVDNPLCTPLNNLTNYCFKESLLRLVNSWPTEDEEGGINKIGLIEGKQFSTQKLI